MIELNENFQGYLQLHIPKIKWILVFGLLFFVLFLFFKVKGYTKKNKGLISTVPVFSLSMNCAFIFVMTLFGRTIGECYNFELMPFESYIAALAEGDMELLLQIIMNIVMYIPLGFLLPCCFKRFEKYRYVILTAIVSSLSIEVFQVIFRIGLFETDDILNNVLGAMVGYMIYVLVTNIMKK